MDLTTKRSSREACAAFSENSLQKLHWFTTLPPPFGVVNIPIHTRIDIDETGFYLGFISTKWVLPHYMQDSPSLTLHLELGKG